MGAALAIQAALPALKKSEGRASVERLGTPEDIAALAAFLLSPEADWITGQTISVDGGRSTLRSKG